MTLEEAKEFVRIHNITGDVIYATSDGGIYVNTDFKLLQDLEKDGVTIFQVFPELPFEPIEKKPKKDKE